MSIDRDGISIEDSKLFLSEGLIAIKRRLYKQEDINNSMIYKRPQRNWASIIKYFTSCNTLSCILSTIPILTWLPNYKWNQYFLSDFIAGTTIAVMHIPQGIGYALLGNVPAIVGIYMAFFPVLIYTMLGTSRHESMGTFAVVCLMTGKVVAKYGSDVIQPDGSTTQGPGREGYPAYRNLDVAVTVTFTVSVILLIMYVLHLGTIANLLSDSLVNGFTCGCAFHVIASQLKDVFGLPMEKRCGVFSVPKSVYDVGYYIPHANIYTCLISSSVIVIIVVVNTYLKPLLAKRTNMPVPTELVLVATGTVISYYFKLNRKYKIMVVGFVPKGFPDPSTPMFDLIPAILLDCFIIALVSYAVSVSLGLIYAHKGRYELCCNQEALAMGCGNMVGCFFSCMPMSASLSRTSICFNIGGKTQFFNFVTCFWMAFVLLWVGPVFKLLPRCVLASIIVCALKPLLLQGLQIFKYCRLSKWDAVIWFTTFIPTVCISIGIGLASGILVSIYMLMQRAQIPYTCLLGVVPKTDIYLDVNCYSGVLEIQDIAIFHYCGSLNFANRGTFKSQLMTTIGFQMPVIKHFRRRSLSIEYTNPKPFGSRCIIMDCSSLTYVDFSGLAQLHLIRAKFSQSGVDFCLVACSVHILDAVERYESQLKLENVLIVFPTIHDAAIYYKTSYLQDISN